MALDSDCDGDIDIVPSLDTDNDGGSASGNGSGDGMVDGGYIMNALQPAIERIVKETVEKMLQPTVQRYSAIASRFAQIDTNTQHENPELTRRLESVEGKLTGLDEVRSLLSEVKGLAEKIAAQPTSGGPVLNSTALNRERTQMSNEEAIERVRRLGLLTGKDDQISAALAIHKAEYGIK